MRLDGTLKTWNDDRGFRLHRTRAWGPGNLRLHIKAFRRAPRSAAGGEQALTFAVMQGADGRKPRAFDVQYPVRMRTRRAALS